MASITSPDHFKSLTVSDGTKYGYVQVAPQPGKPTLLFLHGYPSSSYHWHNQVQQCIDAGYGMIAPDLLGYGDTSKPAEVSAYDNTVISIHVIEILDHENEHVVVGVGHDWGAILMSTTVRMYPKRFSLLVFLAVGYSPGQAAMLNIDATNALTTKLVGRPLLGYWPFHNSPEAASVMESAEVSQPSSWKR
jgi:soluble epoxide hydrolase/lipid-phosphate phosphatase